MARAASDKRKYQRILVKTEISGVGHDRASLSKGEVLNLSTGGMSIETDGKFTLGRQVVLGFETEPGVKVEIRGDIVWGRAKVKRKGYGIRITDMSLEEKVKLDEFILANVEGKPPVLDERRESPRIPADLSIELCESKGVVSNLRGRLLDVSLHGAHVESEDDFNIGEHFVLQLNLPGRKKMSMIGEVSRIEHKGAHNIYGIEFNDVSEPERQKLSGFLAAKMKERQ